MSKYRKNISRIQSMLDGDYKTKIQSGYESAEVDRKVGDKWVDSDGIPWEQKDGYRLKGRLATSPRKHYTHDMKCSDCGINCTKNNGDRRHYDTWIRMGRCFHCQINFEVMLKSRKFGEKNNLWFFWSKLQRLIRWSTIDKEIDQYMETYWEEGKNILDKSVANALTNANLEGVRYEEIK